MFEASLTPDIDAVRIVQAFDGNGQKAVRQLGVPARVVYLAVKLVAAERDFLLSLQAVGVISELQHARLVELLGLLMPGPMPAAPVAAARKVKKKPLVRVRPLLRGCVHARGRSGSSS